jgi:hypothetical protein
MLGLSSYTLSDGADHHPSGSDARGLMSSSGPQTETAHNCWKPALKNVDPDQIQGSASWIENIRAPEHVVASHSFCGSRCRKKVLAN